MSTFDKTHSLYGKQTGEPCIICGGEGATCNWELCVLCRFAKQVEHNKRLKKLHRQDPLVYPWRTE